MNCSGAEILPIPVSLLWADGFICAIALLTLVKNTLDTRTIRGLGNLPPFIGYIRIPRLDYPCAAHPGN